MGRHGFDRTRDSAGDEYRYERRNGKVHELYQHHDDAGPLGEIADRHIFGCHDLAMTVAELRPCLLHTMDLVFYRRELRVAILRRLHRTRRDRRYCGIDPMFVNTKVVFHLSDKLLLLTIDWQGFQIRNVALQL